MICKKVYLSLDELYLLKKLIIKKREILLIIKNVKVDIPNPKYFKKIVPRNPIVSIRSNSTPSSKELLK